MEVWTRITIEIGTVPGTTVQWAVYGENLLLS
jgi:hypothetical protein